MARQMLAFKARKLEEVGGEAQQPPASRLIDFFQNIRQEVQPCVLSKSHPKLAVKQHQRRVERALGSKRQGVFGCKNVWDPVLGCQN